MFSHISRFLPATTLPECFASNPNTRYVISDNLRSAIDSAPHGWELESDKPIRNAQSIEAKVMSELYQLPHHYHNGNHTKDMRRRALQLIGSAGRFGDKLELVGLAATFHDAQHVGVGIRQKKFPNDMRSNEEVAALYFDEVVGPQLTIRQRLEAQGLILATSFGQGDATVLPDPEFVRPYGPNTELEHLFQFADISGFDEEPLAFLVGGLAVSVEGGFLGTDIKKFGAGQIGFLGYVTSRLNQVRSYLGDNDLARCESRLAKAKLECEQIRDGGQGEWSCIAASLHAHAVQFGIRA